jgi:flagellar biogenesis protein FliO
MDDLQPILAVILVLSLLGGLLFFLRRRGIASFQGFPAGAGLGRQASNARQLKVVERVPLGAQHALHLVRVGDRLMLVATAPGSCQVLDAAVREGAGL